MDCPLLSFHFAFLLKDQSFGRKRSAASHSAIQTVTSQPFHKCALTAFVPLSSFSFPGQQRQCNSKLTAWVDVLPSATPKACLISRRFSMCCLLRQWMSHKPRVVKWKPIISFMIRSKQCLPCFIFIGIISLCFHHVATGDFFHAEACSLASQTLSSSQTLLTSAVCSVAAEAGLFKEENMFCFILPLFLVWSSNYT